MNYKERVSQQIAQYAATVNMHDLPAIFHIWSNEHVRPGLVEVFGVDTIPEFYASAYLKARTESSSGRGAILSIGCGDGSVEIEVARALAGKGARDFQIIGADLSPILLKRLRDNVKAAGLSNIVVGVETDLNNITLTQPFDMIMANHALHHIVELEKLFDFAKSHLTERGLFATSDMIGRNGHQRWPETAAILNALWPTLSEKQRFNIQLSRFDDVFTDHDCSTEGFEGIRAQDILPLLLERFWPAGFLGFGGFIDVLVDRSFGHSYDVNNADDVSFIRFAGELNDILLDAGLIKPTMMLAHFAKDKIPEKCFRDRSARASIRTHDADWIRFYADKLKARSPA